MNENGPARRNGLVALVICSLCIVGYFQWGGGEWQAVTPEPIAANGSESQERVEPVPQPAVASSRVEESIAPAEDSEAKELAQPSPSATAPTTGTLRGVVTGDTGESFSYAWVWTLDDNGERRNAKVGSDGRYELPGIELGHRRIMAGASHHHDAEITILFDESAPEQEHDFQLRAKQRIRVRLVTSTGEPAIEAMSQAGLLSVNWNLVPVATREDPGQTFDGVVGSLNNPFGIGSFWQAGFQGLDPLTPDEYGTVTLHEDGPAWLNLVAAHQVIGRKQVDPFTEMVVFVVDPAEFLALQGGVHGRLIDGATGAPLLGSVQLTENPFPMGRLTPVDADGRFSIPHSLPGKRFLVAQAPDRAESVLPVEIGAGGMLDVGDITLQKPVLLSGKTIDEAGRPIQAVIRVGKLDPESGRVDWVRQRSFRSDEAGVFNLNGLAPAVWVVQSPGLLARSPRPFDDSSASLPVRVDARDKSVDGIELTLKRTGSVLLVATDQKKPWPYVRAYEQGGLPVSSAWVGRWALESPLRLPHGNYELVVELDGVIQERRAITVAEQPQRLTFDS